MFLLRSVVWIWLMPVSYLLTRQSALMPVHCKGCCSVYFVRIIRLQLTHQHLYTCAALVTELRYTTTTHHQQLHQRRVLSPYSSETSNPESLKVINTLVFLAYMQQSTIDGLKWLVLNNGTMSELCAKSSQMNQTVLVCKNATISIRRGDTIFIEGRTNNLRLRTILMAYE